MLHRIPISSHERLIQNYVLKALGLNRGGRFFDYVLVSRGTFYDYVLIYEFRGVMQPWHHLEAFWYSCRKVLDGGYTHPAKSR